MARVVFFGSPDFAVPSLKALASSDHRPVLVVSQPDRPAGRGKKERPTPVKAAASGLSIPVATTHSLKDEEIVDRLVSAKADYFIVAAFGLIFPKRILDIPAKDCINVHASLLPAWRGASPVNMAIVNGDEVSGVSIMRMVRKLDAGPVFSREIVTIDPVEDAGSLSEKLARAGASLLVGTLDEMEKSGMTPIDQEEDEASYAGLLRKEDGLVPWGMDAQQVHDHIRGMNPWPGSFTWHAGKYLKILRARAADGPSEMRTPGEIVSTEGAVTVACGKGLVRVEALQVQGKRPLEAEQFLRGYRLVKGDRFGGKDDE